MPITQEYEAARRANELRYTQAMSIYDEIIKRYQPGGTFGKAALGQLEKEKVRTVGRETQQMISSGLYGTTTTAGLPTKWEAEVGAPARLRLEDIMMQRLSQAQIGKAGFIERREDVYPDVGRYAGYATQTAAAQPPTAAYQQMGPGPLERSRRLFGGAAAPAAAPTPVAPTRAPTPTAPSAPSPGSPAALWAQGPEVWGKSLEAERGRAGVTTTTYEQAMKAGGTPTTAKAPTAAYDPLVAGMGGMRLSEYGTYVAKEKQKRLGTK